MSLQRCQAETTSKEFGEWQAYQREEVNLPQRSDYYLAQIAAEVRRTIARTPRDVKLSQFILEFENNNSAPDQKSIKKRTEDSKFFWLGIMHANKNK